MTRNGMRTMAHSPNNSASRSRLQRVVVTLVVTASLLPVTSGCRFTVGMLRFLAGDAKVSAPFTQTQGVDLTDGDHRLLVLCRTAHGIEGSDPSLSIDVVDGVEGQLRNRGVEVVDSGDVANWLDEHGTWDDVAELGGHFEADYVAVIDLHQLTFHEPHSSSLYRGHAMGRLMVYTIRDLDGTPSAGEGYETEINVQWPHHPVSTHELSEALFQRRVIDNLCRVLARQFHDYHERETI